MKNRGTAEAFRLEENNSNLLTFVKSRVGVDKTYQVNAALALYFEQKHPELVAEFKAAKVTN